MGTNLKFIKYVLILLASIIVIYIWIWIYYIIWFNSYKNHMNPFENLSITQTGSNIEFWWAWPGYGKIVFEEDRDDKKIYLKYLNDNKKLELYYIFDIKKFSGYEMCYLNSYWEYCFGKIK